MKWKFLIGVFVLLLYFPIVLGGWFNPDPPPPMIGPTGPQGPMGPPGPPGNYSIGYGLELINNGTEIQINISILELYNETQLILDVNSSLYQSINLLNSSIQDLTINITNLYSSVNSLNLSIIDLQNDKLDKDDQRYNDTVFILNQLLNYYNKTESDLRYYPLNSNPAEYINESYANNTYYPITNPSGYINSTDLDNLTNGTWVKVTGDTMTGSLNMSNQNITDVDTLFVHNISGRSPIQFLSPVISNDSITAGTFYGNINGQNGTIYGVTITNGSITNLRVSDSAIFNTSLVPEMNNTWSLGIPDFVWRNFYVTDLYASNITSPDISNLYNITNQLLIDMTYKLNISDQRYNDTTFIINQLLNYYNKSEIDFLFSNFTYNETDPIFTSENATIWFAINGKLNITDQRYNDTLAIDALNLSLQAETQARIGNDSYLLYLINITNNTVNNYYNTTYIDTNFYNTTYINANFYNTTYIDSTFVQISYLISNYYNKSETYNKSEVDFLINNISLTPGPPGTNGTSLNMTNITNNNDGTYTWYFSDGTNYTTGNLTGPQGLPGINGTNGIDGTNGTNGIDGTNGTNGIDGINGTSVNMSSIVNNGDGTYTWYFSDGYNFTTSNLTGPQGIPGINGTNGIDGINGTNGIDGINGTSVNMSSIVNNGDGTYTWYFSDGYNFTTSNLTGPQGIPGINGTNGIDGINGTNGIDGINGTNGINGTSVTFTNITNNNDGTYTWYFSDGFNYTTGNLTGPIGPQGIPGINGTNGIDGLNGTNGINGTSFDVSGPYLYDNGSNVIFFNDTYLALAYYNMSEIDILLDGKLNITDQRYNDTGYINGLLLNYYNQSQIDYYLSLKLNESDQRYNETQLILDVNSTIKQPSGQYIAYNNTNFWINDTELNKTINNISKVRTLVYNMTCTTVSGTCGVFSTINITYQITEIKVIPTTLATNYRFQMTEYPNTVNIIDKDRTAHNGIWDIEKSYSINGQVQANITNANNDELFTISTIYLYNGIEGY